MPGDWDAHVRSGLDLGDDHYATRQYWTPDERGIGLPADAEPEASWVLVGISETHRNPDGEWCGGYAMFGNVPEAALYAAKFATEIHHELVSADPLTVAPSLQCRRCPSHGHIQEGRWV